mmetsp:Transcript_102697/g.321180  ORF Transcript_102697/g.321180 Transcript_102697/m.321180 type:complete len:263 (-) Transcript_102697:133-921(-)
MPEDTMLGDFAPPQPPSVPAGAVEEGPQGGEGKDWLPDEPRMVYVGNLAWSVKWQDLKDYMKQVGNVEFARILTVDGTEWGRSRGIAYVRYSTEDEAKAAVATLNQTELSGRKLTVDVWTGNKPGSGGKGFGGKGWSFGGKGGAKGGGPFFKGGFWGKGFGKSSRVHGDFEQMVYVGNLSFKAEWQELKDHMKEAGNVEFVKILTEDGSDYGRSKGIACVRYTSQAMAEEAIARLNGTEFMDRKIVVDKWTKSSPPAATPPV